MTSLRAAPTFAAALEDEGFVVARALLDLDTYIAPLQREIARLIARAAQTFGERFDVDDDPAAFDRGYLDLVERAPGVQPLVYDHCKNLPAFQRLIVAEPLAELYRSVRATTLFGSAPGSNGVRIDRPGVTKHLAPWHQEFPYQFRSLDGVTFWIPLVAVTHAMGPVVLAVNSHRHGLDPIVDGSPNGTADADIARGHYEHLRLAGEDTLGERYELRAPLSNPGDVLAFDFLTLHASSANCGDRARWSAQIRYFNYDDAYGATIAWAGGVKHGTTLAEANDRLRDANRFARG